VIISVFQSIVVFLFGVVIGVEVLSRFVSALGFILDVLFQRASDVGLGVELELLVVWMVLYVVIELL